MLASRAASSLLGRYSPRSIRDRFAMDVPTAAAASPSFMPAASRALRNGEDSVLGSDISPILDGPCANRNVLHITLCDKRFAVHAGIANNSRMGERLATVGKVWFVSNNKTGCRFLVVDAYNIPQVLNFYTKNGFSFMTSKDEKDPTRIMYFDLITAAPLVDAQP